MPLFLRGSAISLGWPTHLPSRIALQLPISQHGCFNASDSRIVAKRRQDR